MDDNKVWDLLSIPKLKKKLLLANEYLRPKGIRAVTFIDIKLV